ncbi:MAG: hypothetical protein J1D89_02390 [Agathobacter sp.]|nr:hypothetical protein [Agathobacter sp.]
MDQSNMPIPGKGQATASLVLGIISVVFWFFGLSSIISLILGIIGLVLASMSKKCGFEGGIRTAGFVLSLIGTIGGAIIFVTCVLCIGCIGAAGAAAGL